MLDLKEEPRYMSRKTEREDTTESQEKAELSDPPAHHCQWCGLKELTFGVLK